MTNRETSRKTARNRDANGNLNKYLILHNDDVHTFDYVIQSLMEICDHDYIQASQCAIITHYKGKCEVKHGNFPSLKAMKDALSQKELKATID